MHRSIRGALALLAGLLAGAAQASDVQIQPYVDVVGGLKGELDQAPVGLTAEPRLTTLAVSRFGVRAMVSDWIYVESEFEANAGLHGTSVWEAQAAMQVRNQLIRLFKDKWMVEVGRITDEASVNFFSAHVADLLLTDSLTRDPFLYSGFNMGNGVLGQYELAKGLRLGFAFNSANPVSTTATLVVGGTYPPFERFYLIPYQSVNVGPSHIPDDRYNIMIFTPSLLYKSSLLEARAAFQYYIVNTDERSTNDDNITGFNARASVQLNLGKLVPFANFSFNRNDVVTPNNLNVVGPDKYVSLTYGGGLDFNYAGQNGVGVQFMRVQFNQGNGPVTSHSFLNLGTTYWLTPNCSVGARLGWRLDHEQGYSNYDTGETSLITTLRVLL